MAAVYNTPREMHGDARAGLLQIDRSQIGFAPLLYMGTDLQICPDESYDCDEDLYEVNGKKVESSNYTMASTCDENGLWTTVISAAILVP